MKIEQLLPDSYSTLHLCSPNYISFNLHLNTLSLSLGLPLFFLSPYLPSFGSPLLLLVFGTTTPTNTERGHFKYCPDVPWQSSLSYYVLFFFLFLEASAVAEPVMSLTRAPQTVTLRETAERLRRLDRLDICVF